MPSRLDWIAQMPHQAGAAELCSICVCCRRFIAPKRGSGSSGKITDRISRLGTFGGWIVNERGLPSWRMDKYAPQATCGVPIIGGHPDYFREQPPFINSHGLSNHWLTLHAVWSWLEERI